MNLSCRYHRWIAGRNTGNDGAPLPKSYLRHADSCPRCAAHSQRFRSLDSRFRSLREQTAETELPEGLHSKIMSAVREVHLGQVHAAVEGAPSSERGGSRKWILASGVAAFAAALALFVSYEAVPEKETGLGSGIATVEPVPAATADPPDSGSPSGSPIESIAKNEVAEENKNFVPTASRMAQFTGELPALLVAKVSKPYESEMEYLADDLKTATNFLSACLFVPDVLNTPGL